MFAAKERLSQNRWYTLPPAALVISTSTRPVRAVDAETVTRRVIRSPTWTLDTSGVTLVDHPFCVNTGAVAPWVGIEITPAIVASVIKMRNTTDRLGRRVNVSVARKRRTSVDMGDLLVAIT